MASFEKPASVTLLSTVLDRFYMIGVLVERIAKDWCECNLPYLGDIIIIAGISAALTATVLALVWLAVRIKTAVAWSWSKAWHGFRWLVRLAVIGLAWLVLKLWKWTNKR